MPPRKKQRLDAQVQKLAQNKSSPQERSREKGPKAAENENDMSEEEVLEDVPERTAPATCGCSEIDCSDEMVERGENSGDSEDDDFKDVKSTSPFPILTRLHLTVRTEKDVKERPGIVRSSNVGPPCFHPKGPYPLCTPPPTKKLRH